MAKRTPSATVRAPKIPPPTRPLACHACGATGDKLLVESDTDYVKRTDSRGESRRRVAAYVRCRECGHGFDSVHPDAVRRARAEQRRGRTDAAGVGTAVPQ